MRKRRIYLHLIPAFVSLALLFADMSQRGTLDGVAPRPVAGPASRPAEPDIASALDSSPSGLSVTLRAASGATIGSTSQNAETVDGIPAETWDIPYLTLYRNDVLTEPAERTLIVEVGGIEVPSTGITLTLQVETQHGDPDQATGSPARIPVWHETRWLSSATGAPQTRVSVTLQHEFGETVGSATESVGTPTDYFRLELTLGDPRNPSSDPSLALYQEYAFLMENQRIVPLPQVQEQSPGAAPDELIVYYCDMFSVRQDIRDTDTWLPRQDLARYLRSQLVPAMVEAFRVQSDGWGFPWYEEWTGYRTGVDAHRLSVALSDGKTWFHSKAPYQGDASLSINVSTSKAQYATLTDGLMRIFHHELFHHHQRNIYLHYGGVGNLDGAEGAWAYFVEGTAVLAASVAQSGVEFDRSAFRRSYMANAWAFLGREGFVSGALNASYAQISPYRSAPYWRFLYEQCGGMGAGAEDPAAGMAVIRQVLHTLYSGEIVDIARSTDIVAYLPAVVTRALERSSCPFRTYEASLQAFARTIYALRLEGGKCFAPSIPPGCGFYDPNALYPKPPIDVIRYDGRPTTYAAAEQPFRPGIPGSFGIDLVEIDLDPSLDGQPFTVDFYASSDGGADFVVQIWMLMAGAGGSLPQALVVQPEAPTLLATTGSDRHLLYSIAAIDTRQYNRLGLVITRVDARERQDANGSYEIALGPGRSVP
jgi:hypothetical protein